MSVFDVSHGTLKEVAQSMQEGKKMARSLENLATSMIPLTEDEKTLVMLNKIAACGNEAAEKCNQIYVSIAREALKE